MFGIINKCMEFKNNKNNESHKNEKKIAKEDCKKSIGLNPELYKLHCQLNNKFI